MTVQTWISCPLAMIADDMEDADAMAEVADGTEQTATDDADAAGDWQLAAAMAHRAGRGQHLPTPVKLAGARRAARERGAWHRRFQSRASR